MKKKAAAPATKVQIKEKTNAQKMLRRFFSRKIAVAGMIILCSIILLALLGDFICPYDPAKIDPRARFASPSSKHIMGADDLGRDTFARIIDGARLTLIIAGGSVAISLVIGTALGLIAGYKQGWLDTVLSGIMDSLWAFPAIVLAMAISAALGSSIQNIIIAIGVVNIPDFFRIVRSRVITIREMEYVTGARALGLPTGSIEVGKKADLALLDLDAPSLTPLNNPVAALAYSVNGSEVADVIIDGRAVLRNRELLTIDEERVRHEITRICQRLGLA